MIDAALIEDGALVDGGRYAPFRMEGDAMMSDPPRRGDIASGEWLMVDRFDRAPSPPGVFIIANAIGLDVARIEARPGGVLRVIRNNAAYSTYEAPADDVEIVGRVVARMERIG